MPAMDADTLWDVFFVAVGLGMCYLSGLLVWNSAGSERPTKFWKPLGYWAVVIAAVAGAQAGSRPLTSYNVGNALMAWLGVALLVACILGIRHLLSRRDRG